MGQVDKTKAYVHHRFCYAFLEKHEGSRESSEDCCRANATQRVAASSSTRADRSAFSRQTDLAAKDALNPDISKFAQERWADYMKRKMQEK